MILSIFTAIAAAITLYFGGALITSNIDIFYIFLGVMVGLILMVKIAHHSSETNIRLDSAGGYFLLFAFSAIILFALQIMSNTILFKGL